MSIIFDVLGIYGVYEIFKNFNVNQKAFYPWDRMREALSELNEKRNKPGEVARLLIDSLNNHNDWVWDKNFYWRDGKKDQAKLWKLIGPSYKLDLCDENKMIEEIYFNEKDNELIRVAAVAMRYRKNNDPVTLAKKSLS